MQYLRIHGPYCIYFSVQSTQPYITNLLGNMFWLVISHQQAFSLQFLGKGLLMAYNKPKCAAEQTCNKSLCRPYTEKYILDIHWIVNTMGINNLKINIKFIENPFSSSQVVIFVQTDLSSDFQVNTFYLHNGGQVKKQCDQILKLMDVPSKHNYLQYIYKDRNPNLCNANLYAFHYHTLY